MLISQHTPTDCWLCCIAMALGVSRDLVMEYGGFDAEQASREGTCEESQTAILLKFDYQKEVDYWVVSMSPHWATNGFVRRMLLGRRALLTVRSKNREGMHCIYWNGHQLFDPSNKKRYTDWSEVEPVEFIMFNERVIEKTNPYPHSKGEAL